MGVDSGKVIVIWLLYNTIDAVGEVADISHTVVFEGAEDAIGAMAPFF